MLVYTMAYSSFFCLPSTEQCCFINYSSYTHEKKMYTQLLLIWYMSEPHKKTSGNLANCSVFSWWSTIVITSAHLYSINAWSWDTKLCQYSIASARVSKLKAWPLNILLRQLPWLLKWQLHCCKSLVTGRIIVRSLCLPQCVHTVCLNTINWSNCDYCMILPSSVIPVIF